MKYTVRQGLDVAQEYATVKALKRLTADDCIQILFRHRRFCTVQAIFLGYRENPYTSKQFAKMLRSKRLLAFTIYIAVARNV